MRNWKALLARGIFLLSASCGYQWQPETPCPTLTVPFIAGDEEGLLTAEMIRALSCSGRARVVHRGGDYHLLIAIQGGSNENIGYRRDPQKVDGKVRKNLLAIEARRGLTLEATLYRGEEIVHGPFQVTADVEYDYVDGDSVQDLTFVNPQGQLITVLPFSLGQLESVESAQEAASSPLYSRLAQKVVDQLATLW